MYGWKKKNSDIRIYRILGKKMKDGQTLWLNAIRRDKWSNPQISNARLCSKHFISGRFIYSLNSQWKSLVEFASLVL